MRVLIIGKHSYVGSGVMKYLSQRGFSVIGLGREDCDFLDEKALSSWVITHIGNEPIVAVVPAVINKSVDNSKNSFSSNLTLTSNITEALKSTSLQGLIYFSSVDVYGVTTELPLTELSPIHPDTWYGMAKFGSEWIVQCEFASLCPVLTLRIPGIYGPGIRDKSVIGKMISDLRSTGTITVKGNGNSKRDYVHVLDLAMLIEHAIKNKTRGVVNVATGESTSISQLAELVLKIAAPSGKILRTEGDAGREFDLVFDTKTLRQKFPQMAFRSLTEGIQSYLS